MSLNPKTFVTPKNKDYSHTILLVDDIPINLSVLTEYLQGYGYEIAVSRTGTSALKRVKYLKPDIILLDVMMPEMDGFETCRHLKADEKTKDIPVIFMTALTSQKDKIKGFAVGAVDYVTKPLHQEEVLQRIRTHLKIHDLSQHLQAKNLRAELSQQVAQQITSILDLDELLVSVVSLIQTNFNYYFVGILLYNNAQDTIVLQSEAKRNRAGKPEHAFEINVEATPSIITKVFHTQQAYRVNDVKTDKNYLALQSLPDTQAEITLPLRFGSQMIGMLDIQHDQLNVFSSDDHASLQSLADQIAIAIHNAQLYKTAQQKLAEHQRVEKALREANESLIRLNSEKDKFFSVVAHDLKGPFMPLLGTSELLAELADTLNPTEVKEMGQSIHRTARSLFSLLENLLLWAKIKMEQIQYNHDKINLANISQQNVAFFNENTTAKKITVQNSLTSPLFIEVDEYMIDAVFRHLLSNAVKFTETGGTISLSAQLNESISDSGTKWLDIIVKDNGIGIPNEDLATIFNVGKNQNRPGTAKEKGTGLGLVISHEILVQNGCQIRAESVVDEGSTFTITVPLHKEQAEASVGKLETIDPSIATEIQVEEEILVPPPAEHMAILFEYALRGDMSGIQERAKIVADLDEKYILFAQKLHDLAQGFDEEELLDLVEQYYDG
ncbi:response regulator [Anaerolineales bacterium HSG24]|nr:response regulator [Anaerolineales bacterium HSG24]